MLCRLECRWTALVPGQARKLKQSASGNRRFEGRLMDERCPLPTSDPVESTSTANGRGLTGFHDSTGKTVWNEVQALECSRKPDLG